MQRPHGILAFVDHAILQLGSGVCAGGDATHVDGLVSALVFSFISLFNFTLAMAWCHIFLLLYILVHLYLRSMDEYYSPSHPALSTIIIVRHEAWQPLLPTS